MRSVNKVILMGNVAADPEARSTQSGKTLTNFSLATDNQWRDKDGKLQKSTDFHRVTAWQRLGETCEKYLKKGSPIYLEGQLHNRSYEGKDKEKHYTTEITAERVEFLKTTKGKEGEKIMIEETEEMAEV